MKILLVYPETPSTFWGFQNALKFISKKASEPPLGLLTVAAMLPKEWDLRLIDMNVTALSDESIIWADYVFLSGMNIQLNSFKDVIKRCNILGVKVVAGGPLATTMYKDILGVDYFVLNEAENTLPQFLNDLENSKLKPVYTSEEFPELDNTPAPMWELLDIKKYATMDIQYSRGCPYDCEFCSITMLNGHRPRVKSTNQFIDELEKLFNLGWRGDVMIVDDNFIGNKKILKSEMLPELIAWSRLRKYPFKFITEASINLADDSELCGMMVDAGFSSVFVGIETPNDESLKECGKKQNLKRDLNKSVSALQNNGLIVTGGFILGFDNDPPNIFDRQINFIQDNSIVTAMVGLLNAPEGTKLFKRLKSENRLLENFSGNNMDGTINFKPSMPYRELMQGYHKVIHTIYSQKEYYYRVKSFLQKYTMPVWQKQKISINDLKAFYRILFRIGLLEKGKKYFWKLLLYSLIRHPKKFQISMTLAVYGFHFRRIAEST
ncbi:MAG: DUF4070 domain-containing protein [Melioribacteraceae bacterium]|nr:DUF4070 domain-containing protein [Melioribacteraceae bacterium]